MLILPISFSFCCENLICSNANASPRLIIVLIKSVYSSVCLCRISFYLKVENSYLMIRNLRIDKSNIDTVIFLQVKMDRIDLNGQGD